MKNRAKRVTVRWWDGFKQSYEIIEYEPGSHWLWLRLKSGGEKWIPKEGMRWFSPEV